MIYRILRTALLLALATCVSAYAVRAAQDTTLKLPVADDTGHPHESLRLTIRVPSKVTPEKPKPRKKLRPTTLDLVDFHPFKGVPEADFVFRTLRTLVRKGVLTDRSSVTVVKFRLDNAEVVSRVVATAYKNLKDLHVKGLLRRAQISIADLENFQKVVQLVSRLLDVQHNRSIEVGRGVEEMLEDLRKTSGKGQIRVLEVTEQQDGSTVLSIEVQRSE